MIQLIPKKPGKIAIVLDFPGKVELSSRRPLTSPEGKYFSKMLSIAGINKEDCYITYAAHQKPLKGLYRSINAGIRAEGFTQLQKDLEEWKPNLVLAVGADVFTLLTEKGSIFKYRGAVQETLYPEGLKILPTLHPRDLIRGNGQYEPIVINDLTKAKEESEFPEVRYPDRDIEIIENIVDAEAIFHEFVDYPDPVACDIESIGMNGIMTAYGFATSPTKAYVVGKEALKSPRVLRALSKFCASSTPKIFHNGLFDVLHNAYYYKIYNRNFFFDTMIAQHAAMPILPKSLGFCASIYTKEPYWKDESTDAFKPNSGFSDWNTLYIYNGKDCCLTYEVYEKVQKQLDHWSTWPAFNLMMDLVEPCLRAMHAGFKIDQDKISSFADENEKTIAILQQISYQVLGDINIRSHVQKKQLLYEHWGLPKQYKWGPKGKTLTADSQSLEKLERYPTPQKPALGLIRSTMDYMKRRDFYNLKLDPDGRIRTALKITGTYTGRMASSKSITGSGKNLLNIPKKVRHFFTADPGKLLVQMDLSQAEARVVAALCRDEEWLKEFDTIDLHSKVASLLYDIPIEKVRKNFERQIAKKVAHGTHYLLGPTLLSKILKCSMKDARRHKDKYYEIRPKLINWHDGIRKKVRAEKRLRTPFGRVIQFPGPVNDETFRNATAAEPQSTSADYLNHAIVKMYKEGPKEFEFLLQVYDSILFQIPDDLDALVRNVQAMKELSEITVDVHGVPLVIPTDYEIGYSWGTQKEIPSTDRKDIEKVYEKIRTEHEV